LEAPDPLLGPRGALPMVAAAIYFMQNIFRYAMTL
jgi:hypothetical protein